MIRLIIVASASIGLILLVGFITTRLVRSRTRGLSVRLQVFLALAAIVGAFAFGLGLMVLDRIDARSERFATAAAAEQAELIAQLLGEELEARGLPMRDLAARLSETSPGALEGVELIDADGNVLFSGRVAASRRGETTISVDVRVGALSEPRGTVRVTKTRLQMEALLKDFAPTVLVISLVLGAVAALAAAWIGHTIAGPIEALSSFSERVAAGEHVATAPAVFNGREVRRLTQSIESMRRQLEGRPFVETFAADLSHELKNPVAAIRASAEVLDDSALEEPAEARRFVKRIREAVHRIERLLGELLSLAQIEARGVSDVAKLDLAKLVGSVVAQTGRQVQLEAEAGIKVRGHEQWLGRAVSNLVDNAVIHGQGQVRVEVKRDGGEAVVVIENPGAIEKHTRDRIFGRFVTTRADKGGTGLGLAIVRAVAEAHRGHVELVEPGPETVRFQLRLPAA